MGSIFFYNKKQGLFFQWHGQQDSTPRPSVIEASPQGAPPAPQEGAAENKAASTATASQAESGSSYRREIDEDGERDKRFSSESVEDVTAKLEAPEIEFFDRLPEFVVNSFTDLLQRDLRGYFIVPEEEETRWFAVFKDRLQELGATEVSKHSQWLAELARCDTGGITVQTPELGERRYRLENSISFNEFGSRLFIQFFQEGRFSWEESVTHRMENVRLINKFKPSSCLTAKNERDIARVAEANACELAFLRKCLEYGLVEEPERPLEEISGPLLLEFLRSHVFPRKMVAQALADALGVEFVDAEDVEYREEVVRMVEREWSLKAQAVPWTIVKGTLQVAMMDPTDKESLQFIEEKTQAPAKAFCAAGQDIVSLINKVYGHLGDRPMECPLVY